MGKFNLPIHFLLCISLFFFLLSGCNEPDASDLTESKTNTKLDSAEQLAIRAPDSALTFFKEILATEKKFNSDQLLRIKMGMAEARFTLGKQLEAIKDIQKLEKSLVERNDTAQIMKVLIMEGNFFIKRDQNEESRKVFERGLKYAIAIGDERYMIRFRQGLATSLFGLNQFPGAIKEFKKVLSEAQILNDSDVLAVTYQNIALVYYHKQDFATSIDYQRHALTFNRKGIQSESYAEMLNNLGAYYSSDNRVDSALQCYLASERIHKSLKNPQGIIRSRFNQANIKLRQRKLKEAEKEFISLLDEVKKYNITVGEFYVLNSLAEVKELEGNLPLSLALFDSSLNHLLKNDMKYLGTQVVANRLTLIRDKMNLDTNNLEWKKQREYEAIFAVANDDSVLKQFKKDIKPKRQQTSNSLSKNTFPNYWLYLIIGLSSIIVFRLLLNYKRKQQSLNSIEEIENYIEQNPHLAEFPARINKLLDIDQLWKDPKCNPAFIADKISIDVNTLNQLCQYFFKHSMQEVIYQKRIAFACQQLDEAERQMPSMDNLAAASGFMNTTQFYKVFSAITGIQPHDYWHKRNA